VGARARRRCARPPRRALRGAAPAAHVASGAHRDPSSEQEKRDQQEAGPQTHTRARAGLQLHRCAAARCAAAAGGAGGLWRLLPPGGRSTPEA
jgi:hypothetical protein